MKNVVVSAACREVQFLQNLRLPEGPCISKQKFKALIVLELMKRA
jgi:hypothetical protein